jgi:hypothetical protein
MKYNIDTIGEAASHYGYAVDTNKKPAGKSILFLPAGYIGVTGFEPATT